MSVAPAGTSEKVTAALARLAPEHRQIVRLAHQHGLSVREIAEVLELRESTVRRRMLYALRALRLNLDELDVPL